jgi:hypothetical protein
VSRLQKDFLPQSAIDGRADWPCSVAAGKNVRNPLGFLADALRELLIREPSPDHLNPQLVEFHIPAALLVTIT